MPQMWTQHHAQTNDHGFGGAQHRELNMFPAKNGTSEHNCPEMIVTGNTIDYGKHCQDEFGKCAQAHHKPQKKNNMKERSIDSIHLQPMKSEQGGN